MLKLRRRGVPRDEVLAARDALVAAARADAAADAAPGTWREAAREGRYAALLGVAQQATGTEAILYFSPTVLPTGSKFVAFLGNAGVGLAKFLGEVAAAAVSDSPRVGRRAMMVAGSAGVVVGLGAFAALVAAPDPPSPARAAALVAAFRYQDRFATARSTKSSSIVAGDACASA